MNILIFTFGSRGDVQPYVALGVAMQAEGGADEAARVVEAAVGHT
jgi:UDP:flavonoid glycosyltransferase YjiC (YdhE family)